ncbi:MAG TPA: GMC oxidoreductase, partial [Actinomycetota bacterium]|nr:GMC oxidoreductase [Actinomycetota bacterium]
SGDLEHSPIAQSLNEIPVEASEPLKGYDFSSSRLRAVGGTAGLWDIHPEAVEGAGYARYAPLEMSDFTARSWLPHSGWPLTWDDLRSHYEEAQSLCGLGPFDYGASSYEDGDCRRLPLADSMVHTAIFQLGPKHLFTDTSVKDAPGIMLCTRATVTGLETDEGNNTVTACRVARPDGASFRLAARSFVLAAGAVENARLLLSTADTRRRALGNGADLVGRFFMEHPVTLVGRFWPRDRALFDSSGFYDIRRVRGIPVMGHLTVAEAKRARQGLLGLGMLLVPRPRVHAPAAVPSPKASGSLTWRRLPGDLGRYVRNHGTRLTRVSRYAYDRVIKRAYSHSMNRGGWSERSGNARRYRFFDVFGGVEQVPDPHHRVTLTDELDALGQRRAHVRWGWNDAEIHTIVCTQQILAEEVQRTRLGRFEPRSISPAERPPLHGAHHHLGTTRMHRSAASGVVDEDCRVHGTTNLFVAGGSLFPTAGYVNPTLTIVALAARLGDRLLQEALPSAAGPRVDPGVKE